MNAGGGGSLPMPCSRMRMPSARRRTSKAASMPEESRAVGARSEDLAMGFLVVSFERRLSPAASEDNAATADAFTLRRIAVPAFGPSFLFGLGEGAILPVIALTVRQLGGSVALAALMVTLIGIGSLVTNIPASLTT